MKQNTVVEMNNNDVCFQTPDKQRFRLRAAGIIIEDGCILFATNAIEKYYYSIGGAINLGETAEEAVVREGRRLLERMGRGTAGSREGRVPRYYGVCVWA